MKEYRIVTQHGNAKPYSLWSFKTYEACYLKLMEIIQSKKSSISNEYYVLNDFFENKYLPFGNITKYRIEVREITDWRILTEKEKENRNNKNNKILKKKKKIEIIKIIKL